MSFHEISREEFDKLLAEIEQQKAERAAKLPDEKACLHTMFEAFARLRELGWREAIYCPKDRTVFHSISAGSTGIHDCFYEGEWPDGRWWTFDGGDLWPGAPILFKLKESVMSEKIEHIFEGKQDERQAEDIQPSRFRPRYRALTADEKALHDAIKGKADELLSLIEQVKPGRYRALGITALEESIMWVIKELTA